MNRVQIKKNAIINFESNLFSLVINSLGKRNLWSLWTVKLQSLKLTFKLWFKWQNCIVFGFDFMFLFKNAIVTWHCHLRILKNRSICLFNQIVYRNSYIMHSGIALLESWHIIGLISHILLICTSALVVYYIGNIFLKKVLDPCPQHVTMRFYSKQYMESKVRNSY